MQVYEESDCIQLLAVTSKVKCEAKSMLDNAIVTSSESSLNGYPSHVFSVFFSTK